MRRLYDISVPVSPATTGYPGDSPAQVLWPAGRDRRDSASVAGVYHGSLHHGTHVDAPWHFSAHGQRLDEIPLDRWVGPCWVVDVTDEPECVTGDRLDRAGIPLGTQRLLFKTRNSQTDYWREPWNPRFVYLHRAAAQWCVDRGVLAVGWDYLSPDRPHPPDFPCHRILLGHGVVLIETVVLRDVPAGRYDLVAAPVKLVGVDGAWCRALLFGPEPAGGCDAMAHSDPIRSA